MIGDDGSTATTATARPAARAAAISAATSVDLPEPGGPVIPTRCARAGLRVQPAERRLGQGRPVLDGGQEAGERTTIAGDGGVGQRRRRRPRPGESASPTLVARSRVGAQEVRDGGDGRARPEHGGHTGVLGAARCRRPG